MKTIIGRKKESCLMEVVRYLGNIWHKRAVHPELWGLLRQKNLLLELSTGQPPYPILLGVPHHAGLGIDNIADNWINPKTGQPGRPADEAAGLTGLVVFSALRERGVACRMVIAAHPTENDPNKTSESAYWHSIFANPLPGMLFELHGAGQKRRHMLELSAGMNTIARPLEFGKRLAHDLAADWTFSVQTNPGGWEAITHENGSWKADRLQTPALETLSLSHAGQLGFPALHLEMKSLFRRPVQRLHGMVFPPDPAWVLARAIAKLF